MKKPDKMRPTAEEIAEMADRGEDVTPYLDEPVSGYAAQQRDKNTQRNKVDSSRTT